MGVGSCLILVSRAGVLWRTYCLPLRRHHLRHAANARVAGIQVVLLVHHPIARFNELSVADAHAIADRTENLPAAIHLQKLPVLAACHPRLPMRIEIQRAYEISHLHRLQKFAVARIDDDAVVLTVADPDVPSGRIDSEAVCRVELALPDFVTEPLVLEFAVLVDMNNPRS